MKAVFGLLALFGGATTGLIRGDVPGGPAVAVLVLLNGLVLATCAAAVLRLERARLPAAVVGLTLASLQASFDAWIFTSTRGLVIDVWPLAVLTSLAIAWLMMRTSVPPTPVPGRIDPTGSNSAPHVGSAPRLDLPLGPVSAAATGIAGWGSGSGDGWMVDPPGEGVPAWGPEMDWNVQCDTSAVLTVAAAADLTLVTLPVTLRARSLLASFPGWRTPVHSGSCSPGRRGLTARTTKWRRWSRACRPA